jgi:sigma-B regulation protein RsbU (phosphoserine phosphatase)
LTDLLKVAGHVFYETHFVPLLRLQGYRNEIAFDFKRKDGGVLAVIASATDARDGGQHTFTPFTVFPAAQRRQYERELLEAKNALEAAQLALSMQNASLRNNIKKAVGQKRDAVRGMQQEQETGELREQFVAVLGHDLRNPLASISSATRLLSREYTSERATQVLQLMEGSVRRMSGLIDNVLDFARGRLGGGIGLERNADAPLEPVIRQVVDELRASSPEREIITDIELDAPVDCDQGRVGQLLSNLLGNAISHGAADKPIYVGARTGNGLEIWVANGGDAIPEDAMERLFEPFVRGRARGYQQGLGLGLHIASEIAKAHGGSLSVISSDLETRFTFQIPKL